MSERNRAWRRRQGRKFLVKIRETKDWLSRAVTERLLEHRAPTKEVKPHAPGKLTHAQEMRLQGKIVSDLGDA